MPTTLRNTDILFNDGTTQSTAAGSSIPAAFGDVGTITFAGNTTTLNYVFGATIAGSSLRYQTTVVSWIQPFRSEGPGTGALPSSNFSYVIGGTSTRVNTGNTGYLVPGGSTALTGTWRNIGGPCSARASYVDTYGNTNSETRMSLWLRIS